MLEHQRAAAVGALLAVSFLLFAAGPAFAYAGPGADLNLVGYFLSLISWLVVAFSAIFLWPIYALQRKIRGRKNQTAQEPAQPQDAAQPTEAPHVEQ